MRASSKTTSRSAVIETFASARPESPPDAGLVRAIGLGSAVLLVIGSVVGSGIFLTTGIMAAHIPSVPLLLAAWTAGGLLALAGGLTYAEMGAMFPRSGGMYVFLCEAYGPLWGFLFGWAGLLVVLTGSVAAVAVGFAEYFSYFFPALSLRHEIVTVPMPWGRWSITAGQMVAVASIAVLGGVNYMGVRTGNAVQATLTVLKVLALAALPVLALAVRRIEPALTPIVPAIPRPAAAFGVAMIAVMWTYEGWYYVAFASGEIKNPTRNVPLALVLGTLALMAVYVAANLAYAYALSVEEMVGVERIAERAVGTLAGPAAGGLVAGTVAVSTFGCNAAAVIAMSRMSYAMAADGLFFRRAAAIHPVYRTPHVAIVLTCAWSAMLTLTGTYEQLFTYVTFASVLFFVLGGLAIFKLRWSRPALPRPYRTWGYPVVPALFVVGSAILVVNTLIERPFESLAGLGLVAFGLPVYWYWHRSPQRKTSGV
jgi:APA family basic amino acid/polyamine antiporter